MTGVGAAGDADTTVHAVPRLSGPGLAVLLCATFMGQFDFFVVNVAAPSLQRDLHASGAMLQLVVGGYAFAYAAGLVTGGRLGDLLGHRRVYIAGMVAFAASSLACGLAGSPAALVAARLVQGLAAAAMLPQVLALITASPRPARPRALGWFGVASGTGAIAAQVIGGSLVTADLAGLGWRTIFLVNVPIGLLAAGPAARWLPRPALRGAGQRRPRLDPVGAAGTSASLALALLPLTLGPSQGWPPWTWAALAAAVPVAAATAAWLAWLARRGGQPVLDPSLLAARTFRSGLAANAAFLAYFGSFMFVLTLFLQGGLGLDAFQAGLAFAPACVAFSAAALAGPRLLRRHGHRAIVAGALTTAAALAGLAAAAAIPGRGSLPWVIVCATAGSVGNGVVLPALIGAALVTVPPQQAGAAAGALTTAQQFASSAGVAVIGTLFFAVAGRPHPHPAGYHPAMTAAACADLALAAAVAALTALAARRTSPSAPSASASAIPSQPRKEANR